MTTILDEIVSRTVDDLQVRRRRIPRSILRRMPLFHEQRRSFVDALNHQGLAVIAEIKAASPSKGFIRQDPDVADIARQYAESGAAAISVLTEPHFFHGSLEHLGKVRETVGSPLLRKDFVVDPYQVEEARAYGADAVLLIATCLGRSQMDELLHACDESDLGHLVELYTLNDLDVVDLDRVQVIGVNSRDLRTFEVDLDRATAIMAEIPVGICRVAESGISSTGDIQKVVAAGVDAILVGESLMREEIPGEALASLIERARSVERTVRIAEGG